MERMTNFFDPVVLNTDIREQIPQFVAGYGPYRYFLKERPNLGDHLLLTDAAIKHLATNLQTELANKKNITGRDLASRITREIHIAMSAYDEQHEAKIPRDANGKPTATLTFNVDNEGELVLETVTPYNRSLVPLSKSK